MCPALDFIRDRLAGESVDLLSDVLAVMRTGKPVSSRVVWHAPWGQWFAPVPGASGFQVVLEGSCWLVRDGAGPVSLNAGDVVFFPHGEGHALADSPDTAIDTHACDPNDPDFAARYADLPASGTGARTVTLCGAYQLDSGRAHPLLLSLPEVVHLPARLGGEVRVAVDLLGAELERPKLGTDALIPALLDSLLLYILRAWFEESGTRWGAAVRDRHVGTALDAIHRDPGGAWTVASLAGLVGLSRAPFARRFTDRVGQPPLGYLTWWRMTVAARLLRETDEPLRVVAERVGYSSEFAFGNAFKREFGVSPGRYRRG